MLRRLAFVVLAAVVGVSCSRDPEVVKKKYLQNGNRYFEKEKYKEAYIMYRNALKKDAKYSEAYYRVGLTELKLNRAFDALRDFRRAADTDPNFTNPDARVQAGNLLLAGYLSRDDRPAALRDDLRSISDELLKRNAKSVPGLRLKGYLKLTADHDPKAAIEQFRLANQVSPSQPDIVLPLVESLLADGQSVEAEKLGKGLIETRKDFLPIYDVLYLHYLRDNRVNDAESVLKSKAANNPKAEMPLLELAQFYYRTGRQAEMQSALDKLTSNPKVFPDGRLRAGRYYLAIRDFDSSIRVYQDAIRQEPGRKTEYQKGIAEVLISQNKKDEAQRLLGEVLKADPKDEAAQAMRASLFIETGDPKLVQEAITDLQSAVGRQPANAVLRFNLGRALLRKGQVEQARVQFQEALRIRREYFPARLALAEIYMAKREYGNAAQEADTALEYDKRNLPAKLIRANALAGMGNTTQSRNELVETLKEYPNSIEAALQLAVLDLAEKRYKEAEDSFARLHKSNPADLRALMGLSETYAAENQFGKAIAALQAEIAKTPNRLELRSALGNLAYRSQNYDLAIQQFETIIQARPDSADTYVRLAQTFSMKGDLPAAIRTFDKAKQLRPNDPAPYLQLALLFEKSGNPAKARPIYEQILKLQPDHPIALNNLAFIIAETGGDLDQALAFSQKARQKLPDNPDIADTLGWIYIKKNLSDNAVNIFRDLTAKQPQRSTFHYHLGMALYQRGDKPQARKELQSALGDKPSPLEEKQIKDLLGRIG